MTFTARCGLVLSLCLLPSLAAAQDGFFGQFDLEGRYSTRRATQAELKVAPGPRVTRTGKFTSRRFRNTPEFTWTSSDVQIEGRRMVVTYVVNVEGSPGTAGLIDGLTPSSDRRAIVSALTKTNVIKAVYFLSSDKKSVSEYMVNQTRLGDQRFWLWATTQGDRKAAPAVSGLPYADYARIRDQVLKDWYLEDVKDYYDSELADPNLSTDERRKLEEDRDTDMDFSNNEIMIGEDYWFEEEISERYDYQNDPYLDAHGRPIPKDALEIAVLSMFPEYAGIGLSKSWLFDKRTGEVLGESDVMD